MAAPPSMPSPSNQEVQQSATASLKDPPPAAGSLKDPPPAASAAAAPSLKDPPPTSDQPEKKEACAPILSYENSECSDHYLLAKQLLNEGDFEQALSAIEQAIEETKATLISLGVENADLHESIAPFHYMYGTTLLYSIEESTDTQVTVDAAQQTEQEQQEQQPTDNTADDMMICWENLEVARNIVQEMLTSDSIHQTLKAKLQLDLAQILLREGDLQRMNGRYTDAIQDYQACLHLRKLLLPEFDRKVADAHYNLGLSYLGHSSELQKLLQETNDNADPSIQSVSVDHCQKGVESFVECGKCLCGQLALLCQVKPDTILTTVAAQGGFKTTGEEETPNSAASQTLSVWRKNISELSAAGEAVENLKELLDEIQETVDEAERSQDAVREATQLKVQAQNAVGKDDDGVTTTIGFDKPTAEAVLNAPATAASQPMMVVKKKKKRDVPVEEEDSKPAAVEDAKRAKVE